MKIISQIFTLLFITFWVLFLFIDYWEKHPAYALAFRHFEFAGLSAFLLLSGGAFSWLGSKLKTRKKPFPLFNGLSLGLLFLFLAVISMGFAYNKIDPSGFNGAKAGNALALVGGNMLALYLVVVTAYALGTFLNGKMNIRLGSRLEDTLLAICSGIFGITAALFLLGSISLLQPFVLLPLLVLLLVLLRQHVLSFLRYSCLAPLQLDKNLNALGLFSFFLLLFLTAMNFASVNVPMPAGFDALTLYANLPALIADRHALVAGFQPYNWSMFMSLGFTLFNSAEICFGLSWLGGGLSAFALYALCSNRLKMDANHAFLGLLVFTLIPAFYYQSYAEVKVDLGLLFVYLTILILLLEYADKFLPADDGGVSEKNLKEAKTGGAVIVLLGMLTGFAVGIKLTTLYFALALLCAFWYYHHGNRGFFAALSASLWLIFLLRVDDVAGLRQFHLGVGRLQWALFASAALLSVGIIAVDRSKFWQSLRRTAVYGCFAALAFAPWVVKNYIDSRQFSPQVLLNGVQPQPTLNIDLSTNPNGQ